MVYKGIIKQNLLYTRDLLIRDKAYRKKDCDSISFYGRQSLGKVIEYYIKETRFGKLKQNEN